MDCPLHSLSCPAPTIKTTGEQRKGAEGGETPGNYKRQSMQATAQLATPWAQGMPACLPLSLPLKNNP